VVGVRELPGVVGGCVGMTQMLEDLQRWWVTGQGQNCTELGTDSRRAFPILMERRSQFYGTALWLGKAKEKRASRVLTDERG